MSSSQKSSKWVPRLGWIFLLAVFAAFVWGMQRRAGLEAQGSEVIRMLFVPSVEQGTLVERGDELARFIRQDSGLVLRSEVPTSYAAVIQALGSEQADVAWMPAFAYVIANARYGADARLQVVRSVELFGALIVREGPGEPAETSALADLGVAIPTSLRPRVRQRLTELLDQAAPGWREVSVASDKASVAALLDRPAEIAAAASTFVHSAPHDLVGDGRKELEYDRPGTVASTRILYKTETGVLEDVTVYYGCVFARTDSGIRRLEDFTGQTFAFSDETSTSGHIFPRLLLNEANVGLGRVYYAGGHPNVIQAVWDGKATGGSAFYSPPSQAQRTDGLLVGDARYLLLKRMQEPERRRQFVEDVRVISLTNPIPNDLCAVRKGFPDQIWQRFVDSFRRFLTTPEGQEAFYDLLAGVAAIPATDADFDGFRKALGAAGMSADRLLEAEEQKLERRREAEE